MENMSLDEYIASFPVKNNDVKSESRRFKVDRRRSYDEEELLRDSDDEETNEINKDITDEMASDYRFQPQFDLRNKLSRRKGIKPDLNPPDFNSEEIAKYRRVRQKRVGKHFWKRRTPNQNAFINRNMKRQKRAGKHFWKRTPNQNIMPNKNMITVSFNPSKRPSKQEIHNRPNSRALPNAGRDLTIDFHCGSNRIKTHKPIYDIEIQKEIRHIQQKEYSYNGIKVMPDTSGIPLDRRFTWSFQ